MIALIPLTWWLTRTVVMFVNGLIDYSQLHWLPNMLVGLIMLAARILLPPALTYIVFSFMGHRLFPQAGSSPQPKQLSYYVFADTIYTQVVGVSYNNDDGTSRQQILSKCRKGDPVKLELFTYRRAPAFAVITRYGRIGSLDAELAQDIHDSYDEYRLSGTITSIYGGGSGKYYGCRIEITVEEKKYCEPLPPDPPVPVVAPMINQTSERPIDHDLVYSITERISTYCPDLDALTPAINTVMATQCASVSTLQRHLGLGYAQSAGLIDEMEDIGIIGPFRGTNPRKILITTTEWDIIRSRLK